MQRPLTFEEPQITASRPLPSLANVTRLGFDTETTTEPWLFDRTLAGISYYLPDGTKGYIPLRHPGGGNYPEENVRRWAQHELRGKELICANAKHEHHTLKKWGIDLEAQGCTFNDVFHSAALLNEKRFKLNMAILCQEENLPKLEAKHQFLHEMPVEQAAPVAVEDAELAFRLSEIYQPRIEAENLQEVFQLENDLVFATCEMERNGSHLDVELLLQWQREVTGEFEKRVLRIHHETGLNISPTSPDDMSRLFAKLGIVNDFKTEGGKESFGEDQLLEFVGEHELVTVALEARQLASLKAKYLDKYLASAHSDGRVYYSLHQLRAGDDEGGGDRGTIVGRYSSSAMFRAKDGGINVQQVSKTKKMPQFLQRWPIRKLFVAPEGESWISSDASQIQYRFFAHYAALCKMPRLAEAYRENPKTDFHQKVQDWTGLIREFAKNVNFGKLFGAGPDKLQDTINKGKPKDQRVSLRRVYGIVDTYDREFPEANKLLRMAENRARMQGFVKTILGRRRRYDVNNSKERFYSALNSIMIGGEADYIKKKLLREYRERKRFGITLRSTVHDEINKTGPSESKQMIADFMNEQEIPMRVNILWETGVGPTWEDAK